MRRRNKKLPKCLHCALVDTINAWTEDYPGQADADTTALGVGRVIGTLMAQAVDDAECHRLAEIMKDAATSYMTLVDGVMDHHETAH